MTENGLWIKDEINNYINIINAEKISEGILYDVTINQFTKDYENINNILVDEINIKSKKWILKNANYSSEAQVQKVKIQFLRAILMQSR